MAKPKKTLELPEATDVTSFLNSFFKLPKEAGSRCFRGESDIGWPIKPSVMRGLRADAENAIYSELMVEAPSEFSSDKSMFDKLVD